MQTLFYNILANNTDAFLGTVAVRLPTDNDAPAAKAREIACEILGADGAPGGIRAVMSTVEMFKAHGLNDDVAVDFNMHPHPKGVLIQALTSEAMDFIVARYRMMADPIVDEIGVVIFKRMAADDGLVICDLTA